LLLRGSSEGVLFL
jgi:hypothetical protein